MIDTYLFNSKILLVDDQEANIEVLEGLLEMQGYQNVRSVTDPREVIGLVEAFKPDLILLDLLMPHLSGFEVLELLSPHRSEQNFLPVLVLTADITTETKQKALSSGANDFLTKPFDLIEAGLRIKNLLEMKYLYTQLANQNLLLEEKVKVRTRALELSNSELVKARDKAEESNRLKTAFMNNISHEIRTPLNGILGFAPLVLQESITQEEKSEYLKYLNDSCDRLLQTITDYMDISQLVSGSLDLNIQRISLTSVYERVLAEYSRKCTGKNLEIVVEHTNVPMDYTLNSNAFQLGKALSHLMNNALKFTLNGSITLGFHLEDNHLEIYVKDTGIGIEKELQQHIMEAFVQGNSTNTRGYEGNGLGLSIANGLVQLLGGRLQLESEPGMGTTVTIIMPV